MGMFDDIHVEYPLPDNCPLKDFQTKDLGCMLDQYTITESGRLIRHKVDTDYHGDIAFYGNHTEGFFVTWWEFHARFTEGQLQWVRRVVPV